MGGEVGVLNGVFRGVSRGRRDRRGDMAQSGTVPDSELEGPHFILLSSSPHLTSVDGTSSPPYFGSVTSTPSQPTPCNDLAAMIKTVLSRYLDTAKEDFLRDLAAGTSLENWVITVGNEAGGAQYPFRTRMEPTC